MAQWLASKPDIPSLTPVTHVIEGENPLTRVIPCALHVSVTCVYLHIYRNTKQINVTNYFNESVSKDNIGFPSPFGGLIFWVCT